MRIQPTLTLADMKDETGIGITAIQKLVEQLISKKVCGTRRERKQLASVLDAIDLRVFRGGLCFE